MTKLTLRWLGVALLVLGAVQVVLGGISEREFSKGLVDGTRLTNSMDYEQAITLLKDLVATEGVSPEQRAQAVEALASACCWARDFEGAIVALKQFPDAAAPALRARCEKLRAWACEATGDLAGSLVASESAVKLAEEADGAVPVEVLAEYKSNLGKALAKLKRPDEAINAYADSVRTYPLPAACFALADLSLRKGDGTAALSAWILLCEQKGAKLADVKRLASQLVELAGQPEKTVDCSAITARRADWLGATAARGEVLQEIQWMLVQLLLVQEQTDAALAEAKVLLRACSDDLLPEVSERVCLALKTTDGNIARANQFLLWLRWGTVGPDGKAGTEDDVADPFPAVPAPAGQEQDQAFLAALSQQGSDWQGSLARATIYLYWDKPKESLRELQKAFLTAPMDNGVGPVMATTMRVLVQISGDPRTAERYADYQRFGAAGPDGKVGTEDDLADPVAHWLEK
jgi:tetratricopeptide (TPR) repeat protein